MMCLSGEVGTGKTLVLRCLLRSLDPATTVCCYVFHSRIGAEELIRYLLSDLGQEPRSTSKSDLLLQLSSYLVALFRKGVTPVLIVDEAQNLGAEALEEVRLLTNLETAEAKLLQVVLAGQPELDAKVDSHELRQLRQRIMLRFHLRPLTAEESASYVISRLRLAGHAHGRLFSEAALRRMYALSGGIPRLINVLCGNALLSAYATRADEVGEELVREVAADLGMTEAEITAPPAWAGRMYASEASFSEGKR